MITVKVAINSKVGLHSKLHDGARDMKHIWMAKLSTLNSHMCIKGLFIYLFIFIVTNWVLLAKRNREWFSKKKKKGIENDGK